MHSYIEEMHNFKAFKKGLKYFLLYHDISSVEEFVSVICKVKGSI